MGRRRGSTAGHTQTVHLHSGGTITLAYDVNMFEVNDADQEFVLALIGKMKAYKSATPPAASPKPAAEESEEIAP